MTQSNIATAADYADALITARRAKNWLFLILLLMMLAQLAGFFVARYTQVFGPAPTSLAQPAVPTMAVSEGTTPPALPAVVEPTPRQRAATEAARYITMAIDFLGVALIAVLGVVVLLLTNIMLIGRLIGVSRVTSAFVWCIVLGVLLFPWHALLHAASFPIPGVLYTWGELTNNARFGMDQSMDLTHKVIKWARFVGFPVVALIVLLIVQANSSRGLRLALGEADLDAPDLTRGFDGTH